MFTGDYFQVWINTRAQALTVYGWDNVCKIEST